MGKINIIHNVAKAKLTCSQSIHKSAEGKHNSKLARQLCCQVKPMAGGSAETARSIIHVSIAAKGQPAQPGTWHRSR